MHQRLVEADEADEAVAAVRLGSGGGGADEDDAQRSKSSALASSSAPGSSAGGAQPPPRAVSPLVVPPITAITLAEPPVTFTAPAITLTEPPKTFTEPAITSTEPRITSTEPAFTFAKPQERRIARKLGETDRKRSVRVEKNRRRCRENRRHARLVPRRRTATLPTARCPRNETNDRILPSLVAVFAFADDRRRWRQVGARGDTLET
eukprot:1052366-Prorocentrum_minimum.AAC.2